MAHKNKSMVPFEKYFSEADPFFKPLIDVAKRILMKYREDMKQPFFRIEISHEEAEFLFPSLHFSTLTNCLPKVGVKKLKSIRMERGANSLLISMEE
jgi:hypothetical protein